MIIVKKTKSHLKFIRVKKIKPHIEELYELLKKRVFTISHKRLPSYDEHKKFVLSHPYRSWYLIKSDESFLGSIYLLKDNTVGLFLVDDNFEDIEESIKWLLLNHKPLKPIKSVRAASFHINISPTHEILNSILKKIGAEPLQISYDLSQILLTPTKKRT
jgi:hypothetical protein